MPATSTTLPDNPVCLITGDDFPAVKKRANEIFEAWKQGFNSEDIEILEAEGSNVNEASQSIGRLIESIQTLPFFGGVKLIYWRQANFLADGKTASAKAVTDLLGELSKNLATVSGDSLRVLMTGTKIDKRKAFFKSIKKIAHLESYETPSLNDRDWENKARVIATNRFQELGQAIQPRALEEFIQLIGPNPGGIHSEAEKLSLYKKEDESIEHRDVLLLVTRGKHAKAFALADALGDRNTPKLLTVLDEELWQMRQTKEGSPIGLLYGLINKVRVMLLLKEMVGAKLIRASYQNYNQFKAAIEGLNAHHFAADPKYNPLAINPYVLFRALPQAHNYSSSELVEAMQLLLECNRRMVSSDVTPETALQETLTQIATRRDSPSRSRLAR